MSSDTPTQLMERHLATRRYRGDVMKTVTIRINDKVASQLQDLCEEYDCSGSDMWRGLVSKEHELTFEQT